MSLFYDEGKQEIKVFNVLMWSTIFIFFVIFLFMAVTPLYRVWNQQKTGEAQLREAEFSKKVQIEEAQANLESEKLNAQAEIERAKGAAEAIRIEGGSLTEKYIQYLWVRKNQFNDKTTIYIPTEGNLPILEAGRLR